MPVKRDVERFLANEGQNRSAAMSSSTESSSAASESSSVGSTDSTSSFDSSTSSESSSESPPPTVTLAKEPFGNVVVDQIETPFIPQRDEENEAEDAVVDEEPISRKNLSFQTLTVFYSFHYKTYKHDSYHLFFMQRPLPPLPQTSSRSQLSPPKPQVSRTSFYLFSLLRRNRAQLFSMYKEVLSMSGVVIVSCWCYRWFLMLLLSHAVVAVVVVVSYCCCCLMLLLLSLLLSHIVVVSCCCCCCRWCCLILLLLSHVVVSVIVVVSCCCCYLCCN